MDQSRCSDIVFTMGGSDTDMSINATPWSASIGDRFKEIYNVLA